MVYTFFKYMFVLLYAFTGSDALSFIILCLGVIIFLLIIVIVGVNIIWPTKKGCWKITTIIGDKETIWYYKGPEPSTLYNSFVFDVGLLRIKTPVKSTVVTQLTPEQFKSIQVAGVL